MVGNIGRDELRAKLDRGDPFVLLEVLAPRYYRHSHLPGALNLPPGKVAEMAPDLLPDKNAEIVLYCWDAAWPTSLQAARELAAMGYTNVREYGEGKKAWVAAGLLVEGRGRPSRQWRWQALDEAGWCNADLWERSVGYLLISLALCGARLRVRGEVVVINPVSLIIAVLVIILLVILILRLA